MNIKIKSVIATLAALAAVGALAFAPSASAQPIFGCSPAHTCQVKPPWRGSWEGIFGGSPWEKVWPGKRDAAPVNKGPWERAFENAPMP